MLFVIGAALAGSEVVMETPRLCVAEVAGDEKKVRGGRPTTFKVKEGVVPLRVGSATWDLTLPNRVRAHVFCDGADLRLMRAEDMGPIGAKIAMTAMKVQGGIQAAGDVADAASAAGQDFKDVSEGRAPASGSSHTEINVGIGPDGVSSSTSRTTAGPGGVTHESSATQIGPGGVSRTTAGGQVGMGGATYQENTRSFSLDLPGKGGTVMLTRTDGGGALSPPVAAKKTERPAPPMTKDAPPPPPEPKAEKKPELPKEVLFSAANPSADGLVLQVRDPLANGDVFKVNLKVEAPTDAFLLFDAQGVVLGGEGPPKTVKQVVVAPGKGKGTTLVWDGDFRAREAALVVDAVKRVGLDGPVVDVEPAVFAGEVVMKTPMTFGPLTCAVTKMKRNVKEARATLSCEASEPVVLDAGKLGFEDGGTFRANQGKTGWVYVAPGASEKVDLYVPKPGNGPLLAEGAIRRADAEDVAFGTVPLTASF